MLLRVACFGLVVGLIGCDSKPDTLGIDSVLQDAGVDSSEYTVNDDGSITVHAPESNVREVSKDTFSGDWPFTFDSGIVGCVDNAAYIINGDNTYALTGFSRVYSKNKNLGWIAVTPENPHWLPNPEYPESRISVGDIISSAREFCDA